MFCWIFHNSKECVITSVYSACIWNSYLIKVTVKQRFMIGAFQNDFNVIFEIFMNCRVTAIKSSSAVCDYPKQWSYAC